MSSEIPAVMIRHSSNTTDPWPESLRIQADDNLNDPIHRYVEFNVIKKKSVGFTAGQKIKKVQAKKLVKTNKSKFFYVKLHFWQF